MQGQERSLGNRKKASEDLGLQMLLIILLKCF